MLVSTHTKMMPFILSGGGILCDHRGPTMWAFQIKGWASTFLWDRKSQHCQLEGEAFSKSMLGAKAAGQVSGGSGPVPIAMK